MSIVFLYLSVDETAIIHEMSIKPLRSMLHASGPFYYAWVIPGAICTGIFALMYWKFLLHLPSRTRFLYVCAGMVYVGGAIGIETLSAMYAVVHGENNFTYRLISTLEETFEMLGLVIFLNANLHYFRSNIGMLTFKLFDSNPEQAQERSYGLRRLEANR